MEINRTESLDSIPCVDFISKMVADQLTLVEPSEMRRKELAGELLPEPLLEADRHRFVLFPIKHTDVSPNPTR
jgi:hypothetical protein